LKNLLNFCVFKGTEKNTFFASLNTHLLWHFHCPSYTNIIWIFFFFIPLECNFIVGLEGNFFMHIYSCITKKFNRHVTAWLTTYSKFFDNFRFILLTAIKWNIHVGYEKEEGSRHSSLCGWMKQILMILEMGYVNNLRVKILGEFFFNLMEFSFVHEKYFPRIYFFLSSYKKNLIFRFN